jgi:hypothetical protein
LAGYIFLRFSSKPAPKIYLQGVSMGAFGLNDIDDAYQPENVGRQIALFKELGANIARVNLEINYFLSNPEPRHNVNDDLITQLTNAGIKTLLIIEDPFKEKFFDQANQQNGWAWGYKIANRYKGKIFAYQLANEVSGMTIKKNHTGRVITDYDPEKYRVLKEWLIGLSKGIRDADPKARRVITAHWLGTAVIDQLINDGIEFEVIGWNWFSDMGNDPTYKILDDGSIINIPGHFAGQNKEFWFTELNRDHGSVGNGEIEQANYLETVINNIEKSPFVLGLFVYTLLDDPVAPEATNQSWGLVTVVKNQAGKFQPGKPKLAFEAYQKIIRALSDR